MNGKETGPWSNSSIILSAIENIILIADMEMQRLMHK